MLALGVLLMVEKEMVIMLIRTSLAVNDYVQPHTYYVSSGSDFYINQRLAHFSGRLIG